MKQHSPDWVALASAALQARDRLRRHALAGLDSILRQHLDPAVHQQLEGVRRAVLDSVSGLRAALKARRARP
ncbi:MAG: hypothetical protein AAB654_10410 [Acidobacteriota bacterium]